MQELTHWFETDSGQALLAWEQHQMDALVADVFGYHAIQLGLPLLKALRVNRMPLRVFVAPQDTAAQCKQAGLAQVDARFDALPFASQSLDLIVLPHALEYAADPYATLREAERVLIPEGRLIIAGFNPWSLWSAQRLLGLDRHTPPRELESISVARLKDWLRLLSFDIDEGAFGLYAPACSRAWQPRWEWLNKTGARVWPVLGSAYCLCAIKRVNGMRLIGAKPNWKKMRRGMRRRPVAVASRAPSGSAFTRDPEAHE